MILLIDNYDSFTYNVYQLMSVLGAQVEVRRNDEISLDEIREMSPQGIVVSPGPGDPAEAGISSRKTMHNATLRNLRIITDLPPLFLLRNPRSPLSCQSWLPRP